jgi:hypothetical protein
MGFDGLISFLIRNLPNDTFDEVNLIKNYNKNISQHIMIDISFILYNCYIEIENDINQILKYIYSLSCTDYNKVILLIEKELSKEHWRNYKIPFDGDTQDEISDNFINYLTKNDNEIFLNILSSYTSNKLKSIIENLFELKFTKNIILFFDSIPSYSKILEQRKRRIKNYLESQNRKEYYIKYFSDLENDNVNEGDIEYDYFNWMKKKFNCNKIIDSNSMFVKNLKEYVIKNIEFKHDVNIIVDSEDFGEADYKIFKYISSNKLEDNITILSCDSDLVYQLILQQYNYNYLEKNIKLGLFKFYVNSFDYCQYFNSNKILDYIVNYYSEVNNIKDKKIDNFCLDFLLILNFFGNDFLPSSIEIGPEVSFTYLIKTYYQVFGKLESTIIKPNLINGVLSHTLDFNNLKLWLIELNKNNSFTKIFLLRYFRVPYNITFILTEKLNLNLSDIKTKILEPYFTYKGLINKDSLEENDIRLIHFNNFIKKNKLEKEENLSEHIKNPLDSKNYPNSMSNYLEQLDNLFEEYLDYTDMENLGLKNSSLNINLDDNMYQNLYNYISNQSHITDTNLKISFDYQVEDGSDEMVENFLQMIYFIVKNFFNDMEFYKSTNLTRYCHTTVPSFNSIINFINSHKVDKLIAKFDMEISNNILSKDNYIDSTLHHLIITPYLLDSNYLELLENKDILKKMIVNFDGRLNNIWCNNNFDSFNKQDPKIILKAWSDLLYKINSINKLEFKNNLLIEV